MRALRYGVLGALIIAVMAGGMLLAAQRLQDAWGDTSIHGTAQVLGAFRAAGLVVDNPGALADQGGAIFLAVPYNAPRGATFTVGASPPTPVYILEYASASTRSAAQRALDRDRHFTRPYLTAQDNLIIFSPLGPPAELARYDAVLTGLP